MQYINSYKLARGNLKTEVVLNCGSRSDLGWWATNLAQVNGRPFSARAPDIIIFSDASRSGWGAFCDGVGAGGPWISSENELHINALELKAAFNTILCFAPEASGLFIQLQMDNMVAVHYSNKCGGTNSPVLCSIAAIISRWGESHHCVIDAFFLPGK